MILYPEVQEKAREELDRVIGRGRLPDFTDRDSLPYINAITREVLRYVQRIPIFSLQLLDLVKMEPCCAFGYVQCHETLSKIYFCRLTSHVDGE